MVNQHQLLAWMDMRGLSLSHRDLPMYQPYWNSVDQSAGFDSQTAARLASLAGPDGGAVDAVYRINFPAALSPSLRPGTPQFTFIVTEYGLKPNYLCKTLTDLGALTRDGNAVITPSSWSRDRLVDFGVDAARLQVVPHGVCRQTFFPMAADERRALRRDTGFANEHFVFSNVGIASWHKGIDQLLVAFARVRRRHAHARLVLKNHRALYNTNISDYFHAVNELHPGLLSTEVMTSILLIDDNMDQEQLRKLYLCTDCYVSPYRAEGFNLPVLEAMACGTPVIVTAGGATDDYCFEPLAVRVPSALRNTEDHLLRGGRYLDIDGDALIEAMSACLLQGGRRLSGAAWESTLSKMSWHRAAQLALDFMFPAEQAQAIRAGVGSAGVHVAAGPRTDEAAAVALPTWAAEPEAPARLQPERPSAQLVQLASGAGPAQAHAAAAPDCYNPISYSIIKRRWLLQAFDGIERVQINHSQLHQDMFVLAVLNGLTGGTYLEIGGHEPVFINNTYLLESTFNWTGVSIELGSEYVQRHHNMRRNACVCADATQVDYEALLRDAGLGPVVDYLSIDVDPPEVTLAALKAIPHDKVRFRVITFEHDYSSGGAAVRQQSRDYLSSLGYRLVVNDVAWGNVVVEDWWVCPELTDAAVVERLTCVDGQAHEHDKYIYGKYLTGSGRLALPSRVGGQVAQAAPL